MNQPADEQTRDALDAWSALTAHVQSSLPIADQQTDDEWLDPSVIASASGTGTGGAVAPVPLRAWWSRVRASRLSPLFLSHLAEDLLRPALHALVQRTWARQVKEFELLQVRLLGAASAPARSHPSLSAWLLASVAQTARRFHQQLQPLLHCLHSMDVELNADTAAGATAPPTPALHLTCRRLLHGVFVDLLGEWCSPHSAADSSVSAVPLRRADVMHEMLLKYYRLNFRVFTRGARRADATAGADGDDAGAEPLEGGEAEEEEEDAAECAMDTSATDEEVDSAAAHLVRTATALPRVEYSDATLSLFTSTCSLLLSAGVIASSDADAAAVAAPADSDPGSTLRFAPATARGDAVPPCLPSSYYLDFLLLLIHAYVGGDSFRGVWDRDQLQPLLIWLQHKVRPFLHLILVGRAETDEERIRMHVDADLINATPVPFVTSHTAAAAPGSAAHLSFLRSFSRLRFYSLEQFGSLRIHEMFSLVLDYPDSLPALRNLAAVLQVTKQHGVLVRELATSFRTRLLRPGTNTRSILEQYVNAIACLRILDPQGMHNLLGGLLEQSGVGAYLRARGDTTRTVVAALWGATDAKREQARLDEEQEAAADADVDVMAGADESNPSDSASAPMLVASLSSCPTAIPLLGAADAPADAPESGLDLSHELEVVPDAAQFGDDSDAEDADGPSSADADGSHAGGPAAATAASRVDFQPSDLWHPEPVEGDSLGGASDLSVSTSSARYLRAADILSLLIDLCGSSDRNEELLLVEYKNYLSERFLHKRSNAGQSAPGSALSLSAPRGVLDQGVKDPLYDTDAEVTHLELMKLRFGDANQSLQDLDIMIKDITNSKRIQTQIMATEAPSATAAAAHLPAPLDPSLHTRLHAALLQRHERLRVSSDPDEQAQYALEVSQRSLASQLSLAPRFSALLLSSEFWPSAESFASDAGPSFKLPATLAGLAQCYADLFHTLKAPRILEWASGSGGTAAGHVVEIQLEMRDGRVLRVECEPIHAAILELFAESDDDDDNHQPSHSEASSSGGVSSSPRTRWSLSDLAARLEMDDEEELASKIQFWLQKGLLRIVKPTRAPRLDDADAAAADGEDEDADIDVDADGPVYQLVELASQMEDAESGGGGGGGTADDGDGSALTSKQRGEQDKLVESYLLGALNNFAKSRQHNP